MRFGEFAERFSQVMATVAPTVRVDVGERHNTEFSDVNHVWVTPEGRCSWDRPLKMSAGQLFVIRHGITIRVWGAETTTDVDRWDAADDLADIVLNAVDRVAPGRAEPSDMTHAAASVQTYGEQYAFAFTLSRGVPASRQIATMPLLPLEPTSPPDPLNPTGAPGTVTVDLDDTIEG